MNRQTCPPSASVFLLLGLLAGTLSVARPALASSFADDDAPATASPVEKADDDAPATASPVDRLERAPHELWAARPARAVPLWVAVQVGVARLAGGERSWSGMVLAGIPLERFAERRAPPAGRTILGEGDGPRLKPPPATPKPAGAAPLLDLPRPLPAPEAEPSPPPLPYRLTPEVVRAAVSAALRRAHLADPEARIDAIAARARGAALFPELRLRVSRLVDESENLAPTEYDPARRTASGGTSLWLEARATWQLDRALFSSDEIALERLRRERAEAQAKLATRVLELLFAWQRALSREADPTLRPEDRRSATLELIELEATLDILTGGWFTRFRAALPRPAPSGPASAAS